MRAYMFIIILSGTLAVNSQARETPLLKDDNFLGEPFFLMHELWEGRGGRSIVTAIDGTVLAFNRGYLRKSYDGGKTWTISEEFGHDVGGSNVVVNEQNGEIMSVSPRGHRWISSDNGQSWTREEVEILPDGFGLGSPDNVPLVLFAMQSGITLMHGEHKGRLLMPSRIMGPQGSNDIEWRAYHYSNAIFSDDGGKTWQASKPFPVLGTGEAALAEVSDGRILYNSREHMSKGNRFIAWSNDGGETWLDAYRCPYLPDGAIANSYGCMGGLIRLPVEGRDILIYSNVDTEGFVRENATVWVSFDGGITWPVKRLVFDGPSAYSNLGFGRSGTPSEGKIYLLFEGGPEHRYDGINVAIFNLSWILDGQDINAFMENLDIQK